MRHSISQEFYEVLYQANEANVKSDYQLIGQGVSANVYAKDSHFKTLSGESRHLSVAYKISRDSSSEHRQLTSREAAILKSLTKDQSTREAGVVKYLGNRYLHSFDSIAIAMSRCDTNLSHVVAKVGELCATLPRMKTKYISFFLMDFMSSMCRGLDNVRRKNIVVGDLKPENILVKFDEQSGEIYCALSDLGSAVPYGELAGRFNKVFGSALHMAPEVCSAHGNFANEKVFPLARPEQVDMYSLGVTLLSFCAVVFPRRAEQLNVLNEDEAGSAALALIFKKGIGFDEACGSQPLVDHDARLNELLTCVSLKSCLSKLIDSLLEVLPQNRLTLPAFIQVVSHWEKRLAGLRSKYREEIADMNAKLVSPLKKTVCEWSFFFPHELRDMAAKAESVDIKVVGRH